MLRRCVGLVLVRENRDVCSSTGTGWMQGKKIVERVCAERYLMCLGHEGRDVRDIASEEN